MPAGSTTRSYRSALRAERARSTRVRIVAAAAESFLTAGWAGTTVREVAAAAGVAVPTVELAFRTKAGLLKAAIDQAIAGDDEPVGVLERSWTDDVRRAGSASEVAAVVAAVLAEAQRRSAGLVLSAFEGAQRDPALAELAEALSSQRLATATWLVEALRATPGVRLSSSAAEAADTVWALMEPALYDRLTRRRGWTTERYRRWVGEAMLRLLTDPETRSP